MSLPRPIRLAQAKQVLRRLKEKEPGFLRDAAGMTPEAQALAVQGFQQAIDQQFDYIRRLEGAAGA